MAKQKTGKLAAKNSVVQPLLPSQLRWTCSTKALSFTTTKDVEPLRRIVGQERAMEALRLGARIRSQGYNIYTSGVVGTGRMTTIRVLLDELKHEATDLYDLGYVHNFKQADAPVLLRFAAGEGRVYQRMLDDALAFLQRRIPALFEEDQFQSGRKAIIDEFQGAEKASLESLNEKMRPAGFVLGQLEDEENNTSTTEVFPVIDGEPVHTESLDEKIAEGKITQEKANQLLETYKVFHEELVSIRRQSIRLMLEFRKRVNSYDQGAVTFLIDMAFEDVRRSFPRDRVAEHLAGVTKHLLENLDELIKLLTQRQTSVGAEQIAAEEALRQFFVRYTVNIIVDHYDTKTAPVIIETAPTYASLFGTIEKRYDVRGYYVTDFTQIKAGSLLSADGGYIILNAVDVLSDVQIWTALKRVMLYGRYEIQNTDTQFQLNTLKPEWIRANVKIILLGDPQIYMALWAADEDFHKMFKVHAEFDSDTALTQGMIDNYCAFFSHLAHEEELCHCDKSGAAALVEWAVAFTESQEKITLQFSYVADLMREASYFARAQGKRTILRKHVQLAVDQRQWRGNRADEEIRQQIQRGILLLDCAGERVGQVNGLTVYSTGIVSFGKPARITATVSAGTSGIINIEREVEMSGAIHSKGVYILSGLLRSLFSRSQPMSFTASVAFEQSYGGIDGDSASTAEMVALLSAIANLPIRQDLAITGSINQKGDIQPVGGVNEKITGFFEVCKDRGLTGTQGVLLPVQNVKDLMLRDEIIEAVRAKQFWIYPITRLEEAVELLLGVPAGVRDENGCFAPDTVFGKVQHNLTVLHEASKNK
jgi:predicted ATP-dependent protease